ncbi:hypothetical protein CIHG_02697 [Coccidioides immitis H538.4]|uniref:Uncharacterized protein n=1 Tax=Coccidioides immitis H538.4 TaxID=396776 RepID=A0A0J8RLT8_COCIT|nr:hypothetical protein CIHG_02697 [Coccidioides immitis H538.4]
MHAHPSMCLHEAISASRRIGENEGSDRMRFIMFRADTHMKVSSEKSSPPSIVNLYGSTLHRRDAMITFPFPLFRTRLGVERLRTRIPQFARTPQYQQTDAAADHSLLQKRWI